MKKYILNIYHILSTYKKILIENFKGILSSNQIIENFPKIESSPLPVARKLSNYILLEEYTPNQSIFFSTEKKQVDNGVKTDDKKMDTTKENMAINAQLEAIEDALNIFTKLAKNNSETNTNHLLIKEALEKGGVCLTVLQRSNGSNYHTIQLQSNLSVLNNLIEPHETIRKEFVNIKLS